MTYAQELEKIVENYFLYIKELRRGEEGAVGKLVDLWDEDGVFEFAGSPPVTGAFKGRMAIHTLYKNRVKAVGMPIMVQGKDPQSATEKNLGIVDSRIERMRVVGDGADSRPERVIVGWTSLVGTKDKKGFEVSGSHTFTFKDHRIVSLNVVVSPKPDETSGLSLKDLAVDDIGRLTLAAWAIV